MKIVSIIGFIFSFIGLILYFPPLADRLVMIFGALADKGGLALFSVGWAILFASLVFHLGVESHKKN